MNSLQHQEQLEQERVDVSLAGFIGGIIVGIALGATLAVFFT